MPIKYRSVSWEFNSQHFSNTIRGLMEKHGVGDLAIILEVGKSTLVNWANGNWQTDFPHPHLSNFLHVCNMADLDPREFFTTGD